MLIVYYVPERIMIVITLRATMLAGDRGRGAISPASILSESRITRIVCIGAYSILCDFGAFTIFSAYTRIQSEKVEIVVIIVHLTWDFANTSGLFKLVRCQRCTKKKTKKKIMLRCIVIDACAVQFLHYVPLYRNTQHCATINCSIKTR